MKKLMIAAAFISVIGLEIMARPTDAHAQQRGTYGSSAAACPIGTCGPTGGRYAKTADLCKPSNCQRR